MKIQLFSSLNSTYQWLPSQNCLFLEEIHLHSAMVGSVSMKTPFDGIELHFGHGFGAAGWLSPLWNHRTDDWGGSVENRSRYGVEVVKAVRDAVGEWPVITKINSEDGIPGGVTHDEVVYFAGELVKSGINDWKLREVVR